MAMVGSILNTTQPRRVVADLARSHNSEFQRKFEERSGPCHLLGRYIYKLDKYYHI